jgi:hypothetical protein
MLSRKRYIILVVLILGSLLYSINLLKLDTVYANTIMNTTSEISLPVYMITTRGDLNFPTEESGDGYNNHYQFGDINQLKSQCPAEIGILIKHGMKPKL